MRAPRMFVGAAAAAVLALSACATAPPPPTDAIAAAETALKHAEEARVADESAVELNESREKLTAARTIAADREADDTRMMTARKLADEARVEAELASAKSATARQELSNREVRKTIDVMRFETQRNGGNQ